MIDMVLSSGKPIIGHNLMLDLCHTFSKFIERLPENVTEFKEKVLAHFPV